ncbi:MAG: electron transport complex subunit RsxG [Gammaproteobacteria bacterium]|nr:electron transport complex subunit RsxG [Gammaproteobacteria bacterium]
MTSALLRSVFRSGLILGTFAVVGVSLVAMSFEATKERVDANRRAALLRSLYAVVKPEEHDNDLFDDVIKVSSPLWLGTEDAVAVYRARMGSEPVAAVLTPVAPDGYNGSIRLLVGIYHDGTLAGVRVVGHRETPGLGDGIDERRSDWIYSFDGRSLEDPGAEGWRVKRDGGVFDQFTGATITPRAVVKAVHRSLQYFVSNREELFDKPSDVGA